VTSWQRRWTARWIWAARPEPEHRTFFQLDPSAPPPDTVLLLRTEIAVDEVPGAAPCRVTADGRYQLFVNGVRVGRGPGRGEPNHLRWDEHDLAPYLVAGPNALALLVRNDGQATPYFRPPAVVGQLGQGGVLLEASIGDELLVSDASWRTRLAPYVQRPSGSWAGPPAVEIVDGRDWPVGWSEPGFDDTGWTPAAILEPSGLGITGAPPPSDPFGMLAAAEIGQLAERVVEPVKVVATGPLHDGALSVVPLDDFTADPAGTREDKPWTGSVATGTWVTLDLGQLTNSHAVLVLDADPGTVVDLAAGEDLDASGHPVVAPRHWTMRYTAAGRPGESVEALEPVGMRWLQVAVREGALRSVRVTALYRHYPRPDGADFRCDDESLESLWHIGAATLDACSTDAFMDCPGREQRAWVGDAYVESLVSLVCNPDLGLVRRNLWLLGQGVRTDGLRPMVGGADFTGHVSTIPDFSLHWVRTIARVYEHNGDLAAVERLWPRVLDALQWFEWHRGPDGLLRDLTGWLFVDWAQTERNRNTAAADALYALALKDAAVLADALDDVGTARRLRDRFAQTAEAFELYWDGSRGVYVDAADGEGQLGRRVSQQTNVLAFLSGAAPAERWDGMLDYVLDAERLLMTRHPGDGGPQEKRLSYQFVPAETFGGGELLDEEKQVVLAQPFFCHLLHQALVRADRFDDLLASLRRWRTLADRGNGVFEEYWEHVPGHGSRCHAWSATPTYDLTTHLLGVKYRNGQVEVTPWLGPLRRLSGTVPTPHGPVEVELTPDGGTVRLPAGVTGRFAYAGVDQPLKTGDNALTW
jgi:hypothetical protein